jgi:tetratricopeptide (TPR) repeat protein/predicted Ser/Thr protein kinase
VACPDDNTLIAMVEHELDPARFAELELHIDACEGCRKMVAAAASSRSLAIGTPTGNSELDRLESIVDLSIGGRYVVQTLLGRGGMGTVYLARDQSLGREVALKLHRAGSGKDRLHREAVAMAKLAHPNVVTVYEVGQLDDRLFVAMEYVRGTTLRGWLDAAPRTWREIVALLLETGRGLTAAHAAGMIHRDFKPENVLVGDDGRPRVGDFGLARGAEAQDEPQAVSSPKSDLRLTQTGALLGTPAYMAPEQLAGHAVDARCDQFAFCVVAWECLFGRRPFAGATLAALDAAIAAGPPSVVTEQVPPRVRSVLQRGLAAEREARYTDLGALLEALRAAAAPRTLRRVIVATVAVVALVSAAITVALIVQARRQDAACVERGDAIRALFDAGTRTRVERAFAHTSSPIAASSYAHASAVLARDAELLAVRATDACRAHEPATVGSARRACLEDRARRLANVVELFANSDAGNVERAPSTAWAIYDPTACEDTRSLLAAAPARDVRSPDLVARLDQAEALVDTANYREATVAAQAIATAAHARGEREIELEALINVGNARAELEDDPTQQAQGLQQALALAEALGHDAQAANLLGSRARLESSNLHDDASAHRSLELAHAKLERLGGGNVSDQGNLLIVEAQVLFDENRLGEAEAALRRAATLIEQANGADHPRLGTVLGTLAEVLLAEGKDQDALAAGQRTLAILGPALGDDHPEVAGTQMTLAQALLDLRRFDEARALLQRADEVFARVYGPDHPTRAAIYGNLGSLEMMQEHWEAAGAAYGSALTILERVEGPRSLGVSSTRRDLARVLGLQGHLAEALAEQQRALEILEALGTNGAPHLVAAYTELANYRLDAGTPKLALVAAQRALAIASTRPADANPAELAQAQLAARNATAALAH